MEDGPRVDSCVISDPASTQRIAVDALTNLLRKWNTSSRVSWPADRSVTTSPSESLLVSASTLRLSPFASTAIPCGPRHSALTFQRLSFQHFSFCPPRPHTVPRVIASPPAPMQRPRFCHVSAHHFHIEEHQVPNPNVRNGPGLRLRPPRPATASERRRKPPQTWPTAVAEQLIQQRFCVHQFTVDFYFIHQRLKSRCT